MTAHGFPPRTLGNDCQTRCLHWVWNNRCAAGGVGVAVGFLRISAKTGSAFATSAFPQFRFGSLSSSSPSEPASEELDDSEDEEELEDEDEEEDGGEPPPPSPPLALTFFLFLGFSLFLPLSVLPSGGSPPSPSPPSDPPGHPPPPP